MSIKTKFFYYLGLIGTIATAMMGYFDWRDNEEPFRIYFLPVFAIILIIGLYLMWKEKKAS